MELSVEENGKGDDGDFSRTLDEWRSTSAMIPTSLTSEVDLVLITFLSATLLLNRVQIIAMQLKMTAMISPMLLCGDCTVSATLSISLGS